MRSMRDLMQFRGLLILSFHLWNHVCKKQCEFLNTEAEIRVFGWHPELIKSVEHDKNWADKISSKMPANATLVYIPLEYDADYCRAIQTSDELFDIVIVDGRDRNNCVKNALQNLSETGVVIFDNSNRAQYRPSYDLLYKFGFKSIDFFGMAPGIAYESCTTVFYRYKNCLNI